MGKNATIWHFVSCFVSWRLEDTVSWCFVHQDLGHMQTPRICHTFVLSLLVSGSFLPQNAFFHDKTLDCQIVPVLPSHTPLLPPGTQIQRVSKYAKVHLFGGLPVGNSTCDCGLRAAIPQNLLRQFFDVKNYYYDCYHYSYYYLYLLFLR